MSQPYIGTELGLFADATNWKRYYHGRLAQYIVGDVLEVGAGIGGTTAVLCDGRQRRWVCAEPDAALAADLRARLGASVNGVPIEVLVGGVDAPAPDERFDCVLYIDVLEHIEDDGAEVARAADRLSPGGHLVILVPANPSLYSAFDRAVGHYRRYDLGRLRAIQSDRLRQERLEYLDVMGMSVNMAARYLLRSGHPTRSQVLFWDRLLVPLSRLVDPLVGHRAGKAAVAVYQRVDNGPAR